MNPWSLSLALVVIPCFISSARAKECKNDNECHFGRCCAGQCIWHHFCRCVNDKDCRSGEKCSSIRVLGRICKPKEEPTFLPSKTYTRKFWHRPETHPSAKTETPTRKEESHKSSHLSWRHGSKVILISCLVAAVAIIPCVYYVLRKSRKRPASTNVTVLSPHTVEMEMRGNARATVLEMQPGSAAGATAMDVEADPCPFKAPGVLPPYYSLEFKPQENEREEPPPSYDDAVKPSVVAME